MRACLFFFAIRSIVTSRASNCPSAAIILLSNFDNGFLIPTLNWLNDDEARKSSAHIPYRLLEADASLSFGATETENMLIQGDNLEALKALLPYPFGEMKKLWLFLGVREVDPTLEPALLAEIADNPDEKWQAERNQTIPAILPKGQPGSWRKFFTKRDRRVFKEIAGDLLVKWGYEKDWGW